MDETRITTHQKQTFFEKRPKFDWFLLDVIGYCLAFTVEHNIQFLQTFFLTLYMKVVLWSRNHSSFRVETKEETPVETAIFKKPESEQKVLH